MSALLTRLDAAVRAGVAVQTISDWKAKHGLTPVAKRGKADLFRWEDVLAARNRRDEALKQSQFKPAPPKPWQPKRETDQRVAVALDLEDLAHQTRRGDVDLVTWLRVCRGRFRNWPPSSDNVLDNLARWRRRVRRMNIPMHLVREDGSLYVAGGRRQDDKSALMRFDWPAVLRWTRRVLD